MPQINLESVFRYYCSVVVFGINLAFANPDFVKQLLFQMATLGGAATAAVVVIAGWIVGALFYFFYRSIICDHGINHILDCFYRNVLRRENYRMWLQREYNVGSNESEKLYAVIRPHVDSLANGSIVDRSALIHMGFQAGIICLAFSICAAWRGQLGFWELAIGIFFLVVALIADVRIEDQVRMILQSSRDQFDETAKKAIRRNPG